MIRGRVRAGREALVPVTIHGTRPTEIEAVVDTGLQRETLPGGASEILVELDLHPLRSIATGMNRSWAAAAP